jgi:hypothetical protein
LFAVKQPETICDDIRNYRNDEQRGAEMTTEQEKAIFADIDLCDLGTALTKGALRRKYQKHRKACFEALREMNKADGLDKISTDELLAELELGYETGR